MTEWTIGPFRFQWHQDCLTLICLLNGVCYSSWQLKHCDTEHLAKEFSASTVNDFCFGWVREVADFKRSLGPEPRDRHL